MSFYSKVKRLKRICLPKNDPEFMIVGAQKSGTSTLHFLLDQHPDLSGSIPKEVQYFHANILHGVTLEQYKRCFRGSRNRKYFESTPEYLYYPEVPKRIKSSYPLNKFIVILRNPVERAYSAWNHYRDHFYTGKYKNAIMKAPSIPGNYLAEKLFEGRVEFPSFRESVDIEIEMAKKGSGYEPGLLRRGLYLDQLEEYWKYFEKNQILILGFKDLVDDLDGTLKKVTEFLEVEQLNMNNIVDEPKNQRKYQMPMNPQDRAFLKDYYATPNEKLISAIGNINW